MIVFRVRRNVALVPLVMQVMVEFVFEHLILVLYFHILHQTFRHSSRINVIYRIFVIIRQRVCEISLESHAFVHHISLAAESEHSGAFVQI